MNCESVNVCLKALICIFVQVQASENNFFNFLIWWKSRFPPKGFSYIDQMRHFLKQFSSLWRTEVEVSIIAVRKIASPRVQVDIIHLIDTRGGVLQLELRIYK